MQSLSTLTHRFAAIQIKMWNLQFRLKKIHKSQERINAQPYSNNKEQVKAFGPSVFNILDTLILFEYLQSLMDDVFNTPELKNRLNDKVIKKIGQTKDLVARWLAVRNVIGGHIDIKIVEDVCAKHNFVGVLLSDDLETDIVVYNCLLLEGAINHARQKSDIFGRDLNLRKNFSGELKLLADKLSHDRDLAFECFKPLIERIYEIGKDEKMSVTTQDEWRGLVTD